MANEDNLVDGHNRIIEEIIAIRKKIWHISDAEADDIRKRSYYDSDDIDAQKKRIGVIHNEQRRKNSGHAGADAK